MYRKCKTAYIIFVCILKNNVSYDITETRWIEVKKRDENKNKITARRLVI